MIDYRLKENRKQCFTRYYISQLLSWDIDPAYPYLEQVFDIYQLDSDQKLWLSFLYACYYQIDSVLYTFSAFPEMPKPEIFRKWFWENRKNLSFETDRIYNSPYVPDAYQEFYKDRNYDKYLQEDAPKNFEIMYKGIKYPSFGRYTKFFYTETLYRCCKMPIMCNSIMFGANSVSHTKGMLYLLGMEEYENQTWEKDLLSYLDHKAMELLEELKSQYKIDTMDLWTLETCLCAYKGLYKSTRYMGYYIDRALYDTLEYIKKTGWDNHWELISNIRKKVHPEYYLNIQNEIISKTQQKAMVSNGHLVDVSYYYPDEPQYRRYLCLF